MANFYQVEKEINGKKYTFQFNGISAILEATDNTYIDGTNQTSMKKLSDYLLKNVVVQPAGLTPDDFESMDEFNQVISVAGAVWRGEFREEANEGTATKKSGK